MKRNAVQTKGMNYLDEGMDVFRKIWKNPVLFVPDALMIALGFILGRIFYLLNFNSAVSAASAAGSFSISMFQQVFATHWLRAIISGGVMIFMMFFAGAGADVLKFNMIKDLLKRNTTDFKSAWNEKEKFYFKVVWFKILTAALQTFGWAVGISLGIVAYRSSSVYTSLALGAAALLWIIGYSVAVKLGLLLSYPLMFSKKKLSAFEVIKDSFIISLKNKKHIVITWIACIAASFFIFMCGILATGVAAKALEVSGIESLIPIIGRLGGYAISIASSLWISVFVFVSYLKKPKAK